MKQKKNNISTGVELTDYYFLANYIKKNKINKVLELGTGISTFVIAETLKNTPKIQSSYQWSQKRNITINRKKYFHYPNIIFAR